MNCIPQNTFDLSSRRRPVSIPVSALEQQQQQIHHAGQMVNEFPPSRRGDSKILNTKDEWRYLQTQLDEASRHDEAAKHEATYYVNKIGATYEPMEVAGIPCYLITPETISKGYKDTWLIHIHDGALLCHGGVACIKEAAWMANACQACVLSIDYLRPPLFDVVAAIDDCVKVWKYIIEERHQCPEATALFGSSAGGNLTVATMIWLHEIGLPLPGALLLGAPLVGVEEERVETTWRFHEGLEDATEEGFLRNCIELYAPPDKYAYCSNPSSTPMYRGDVLSYFPPTILIAGARDQQLSETARMHRVLRNKGVTTADLHVFDAMPHKDDSAIWELLDAQTEVDIFFREHLQMTLDDGTVELERYMKLCAEIQSSSCLIDATKYEQNVPSQPLSTATELVEFGLLVGTTSSPSTTPATSSFACPQYID